MSGPVVLIELGGSHDECLYPQAAALRAAGRRVVLVTTAPVAARLADADVYERVHVVELGRGRQRWRVLWQLNGYLRRLAPERIVLNTATGGPIKRLLALPNYPGTETYGILHEVGKLGRSVGQWSIGRRLGGYLVLADYLVPVARAATLVPVAAYYAFELPTGGVPAATPSPTLRLCVPGQVSEDRRAYLAFIELLATVPRDVPYHVTLLGRSTHTHGSADAVRAALERHGLTERFTLFDAFIPAATFEQVLAEADYLLPLIHPGHRSASLYEHQITGTFNLAYARRKTLLMHAGWLRGEDPADTALTYAEEGFAERLRTLAEQRPRAPYRLTKWRPQVQRAAYVEALGLRPITYAA